jgi:hypothetical protein
MKWHVHVSLNGSKESLQPFIRGRIRKIPGENLNEVRVSRSGWGKCKLSGNNDLEAGSLFNLLRRRHAVFGDCGGRGFGHCERNWEQRRSWGVNGG